MTGRTTTERILDAFLAPVADRLADRVIDAALDDVARTPQRRALRVPWRIPNMPALTRATGIAAVALVAAVGAGGLIYLSSGAPGGPEGATASPPTSPTTSPTNAPTVVPSPAASDVARGIPAWTPYTSSFYGFRMSYPSTWTLVAPATRAWQVTDGHTIGPSLPYADTFLNSRAGDTSAVALWVWDMPVADGSDPTSMSGLRAWAGTFCDLTADMRGGGVAACQGYADKALPMCLSVAGNACRAAILVPEADGTSAYFVDPNTIDGTRKVIVVSLGQPDASPATARYGGAIQLMKSILTTMGVFTPQPGQVPGG